MLGAPEAGLPGAGGPGWGGGAHRALGAGGDRTAVCALAPLPSGEFGREELQRRLIPLRARLGRLLRRGQESPEGKAAALCRELAKWWTALWTFARVEGVEPTNNVAERALRPAVLWRKGSFGSDSELGHHFAERLLSVESRCRWLAQV